MPNRFAERLRDLYRSDALAWGLVLIGCALRLRWYLFDRSLWWPEAALALNLTRKPLLALLGPLDKNQVAPIGFLLAVRAAVSLFGNSEFVLRLLPFICGIVTLPLFYLVARKYASSNAVPLALGFFAVSRSQVYFASECKPYMSDLALTLLALLTAVWISERELTTRRALACGSAGAIAIWCSLTIPFVLAGAGIALAWACVPRRDWPRLRKLVIVGACWSLSLMAYYLVSLRLADEDAFPKDFWTTYFLSFSDVRQSYVLATYVFIVPLDMAGRHPWPAALVFAIGSAAMFARSRIRCALLLAPMVCVALASMFAWYPFYHRFLLFSVPFLLLPAIEGVVRLAAWTARIARPVGLAVAVVLASLLSLPSLGSVLDGPMDDNELRPLVAYIGEHVALGDVIYVGEVAPVYKYYRQRFGLGNRPYLVGRYYDTLWNPKDAEALDRLRGQRRVWVISGDPDVAQHLDAIGKRLESISKEGATLYLYDLSASAR